jgi:hypothetical protein
MLKNTKNAKLVGLFISTQIASAVGLAYATSQAVTIPQSIRALTLGNLPKKPISLIAALPLISCCMAAADMAILPPAIALLYSPNITPK